MECVDCGFVALDSDQHISPGHYENSGMHGENPPAIDVWLKETEPDDERRFEMLKSFMTNRRVMDIGCGSAGFLNKARTIAS